MKLKALFTVVILCGCSQEEAPPTALSQGPHYEAHCKEPLPIFTLGENSNPSKDQEMALCACVWENLAGWEREVSMKLAQGKEPGVSEMRMRAFAPRFRNAIEKCGGMKL